MARNDPMPRQPDSGASGEAWDDWQERMDAWRARRQGGRRAAVARGIVSASIAIHGAAAHPQQSDLTTLRNFGDSNLRAEGNDRGRTARGATRDKGNHIRGSGQGS